MQDRWKPSVTVAAIVESGGRFLMIEEETADGIRINNPAGHLDPGESPITACVRETLEETAHIIRPTALLGVYLSRFQRPAAPGRAAEDVTYVRFAFCGEVDEHMADRALDRGILRVLWMTPQQVRDSVARHRSPLVLQCVEDHLAGQRYPLDVVQTDPSVFRR